MDNLDLKPDNKPKKVVKTPEQLTALRTLERYRPIRQAKDERVERARLMYDKAFGDGTLTRIDSLPGYILNMVVELFVTLAKVPDFRLIAPEATDEQEILMSAFLEHKIRKGGFHDLMETGWSGLHELALAGSVCVTGGTKTEEDGEPDEIGMPIYQMLPSDNTMYNPTATRIRVNTAGGDAFRFGYIDTFELETAEEKYPGILKIADPGDIPNVISLYQEDELTDEQRAEARSKQWIQVLTFFDRLLKVDAVYGGSNAAPYKELKGDDYEHKLYGKTILPVGIMNFFPKTKGIEGVGAGEMFYPIADNIDKISSAQLNNTTDNYNAPAIISIADVEAEKVFGQLEMAKQKRLKGESSFMSFDPKNGIVGQNQISYIRNDFPYADTEAIVAKMENVIKRLGFNLDFFFTDPDKTLGQTEFDIEASNSTVSKIMARNTDFFQYIYRHGGETITANGDVNSEKPFGAEVTLDIEGEEVRVSELAGKVTTEGEIIQWFKDFEYTIEINTKTGVRFNNKLEERTLLRRLDRAAPGSQEQLNVLNALAFLGGSKRVNKEDLMGPQGAPQTKGAAGAAQAEFEDKSSLE